IGTAAFGGCSRLTAINVDASNPAYSSVSGILFNHSQTTLIQYPIGQTGTSYTIPNSVTSIGVSAFSDCARLANLTIGINVASIGDSAFYQCSSLTNLTIPEGVTTIGGFAFSACSSLTNITVDPLNSAFSSVDGVLFNHSQTTLVEFPGGKVGSYTI